MQLIAGGAALGLQSTNLISSTAMSPTLFMFWSVNCNNKNCVREKEIWGLACGQSNTESELDELKTIKTELFAHIQMVYWEQYQFYGDAMLCSA